ncbi:MAG: HAD-IIB family hydrolase [Candidatus Sedimenticola endophacoides]
MNRRLLCTDLDRTLLPNGAQPESPGARSRFARLIADCGITLVYVTGRHLQLVREAIQFYDLPRPHYAITDVGTRIYEQQDGQWNEWERWGSEIGADWAGHSALQIHSELLHDLEQLRLQEWNKQGTHKLSYYIPPHADQQHLSTEIGQRLQARGIHASVVCSMDEPAGIGLLDILPRGASKLHAIGFLCEQLGIELQQTLFAGDSGNDMQVLTSPIPSVLVANASPEVRDAALAEALRLGTGDALYCTRGGFRGMNGNYSAGILEGAAHFHPGWLESPTGEEGGQ